MEARSKRIKNKNKKFALEIWEGSEKGVQQGSGAQLLSHDIKLWYGCSEK